MAVFDDCSVWLNNVRFLSQSPCLCAPRLPEREQLRVLVKDDCCTLERKAVNASKRVRALLQITEAAVSRSLASLGSGHMPLGHVFQAGLYPLDQFGLPD